MYWREDKDTIYSVYEQGRWEQYADIWYEGDPLFSCPDGNTPSNSPPTPLMGFGKIWCINPNVRLGLGWATEAEHAFDTSVQHFEHGLMLRTGAWTWVLYSDGTWERR